MQIITSPWNLNREDTETIMKYRLAQDLMNANVDIRKEVWCMHLAKRKTHMRLSTDTNENISKEIQYENYTLSKQTKSKQISRST